MLLVSFVTIGILSFKSQENNSYIQLYHSRLNEFTQSETELIAFIKDENIQTIKGKEFIRHKIEQSRLKLKGVDFWLRYFDPVAYHRINGPLPVEWETEVFEKFEPPYKREGAGLSLAELYLDEMNISTDSLIYLVQSSVQSTKVYLADSITRNLTNYQHFYLANRLFLLNLTAIYTTGFECPGSSNIIPELVSMLKDIDQIYVTYNESFPGYPVKKDYLSLLILFYVSVLYNYSFLLLLFFIQIVFLLIIHNFLHHTNCFYHNKD